LNRTRLSASFTYVAPEPGSLPSNTPHPIMTLMCFATPVRAYTAWRASCCPAASGAA